MHQVIGKPFLTRAEPNRHWEKLVKNYERQREEKREKVENRELLCYCANVHRFHQSSQKHGIFTTHPELLPPRSFYLRREGVLSERITYIIDTLTLPVWRGGGAVGTVCMWGAEVQGHDQQDFSTFQNGT